VPDESHHKQLNPLLFIHGSGDSARIWRPQLDHFGPSRALAIDLPGHGERPDNLPETASVQDYTRAVYKIVTRELQLNHPIIAGHSLGGAIALTMALDHRPELGGLILIGTGARLRVLPELLEAARATPEEANFQLKAMGMAYTTPANMATELINEQVMPEPNMLYRDLAACDAFDCMARLSEIHLPTLILCGAEDRSTPLKYSQYLHEHIAGSVLRVIPDAGHFVLREQPKAVNLAIEEWMQQH
jgi:pimeloyl-ACP methyl ester carboxylesterase